MEKHNFIIYAILIKNIDGVYIGASGNFNYRCSQHLRDLSNGRHSCKKLQEAFLKANCILENVQFKEIEQVIVEYLDDLEDVCKKEISWQNEIIEERGREYLYNNTVYSGISHFKQGKHIKYALLKNKDCELIKNKK